MVANNFRFERAADEFFPYLQHISPDVVLLDDGSVMAMVVVGGTAFELEPHSTRNGRSRRMNTLVQLIGNDNVTMHINLVHTDVKPSRGRRGVGFLSTFARDVYGKYEDLAFGQSVKENTWIISIIVSPRAPLEGKMRRLARDYLGRGKIGPSRATEQQLEDVMQILKVGLERYGVRRLGYLDIPGWATRDEMAEHLALSLTCQRRIIPVNDEVLGASIYLDPVVFHGWWGKFNYKVNDIDRPMVGTLFGYKVYPKKPRVGMLNEILGLDSPAVLTHSFKFENRMSSGLAMSLRTARMGSLGDKSESLLKELIEAQDDVASNRVVQGSHHFSLAIYADTARELDKSASAATIIASKAGAVIARETRGAMAAYFAQLPGNRTMYRTRPGSIDSRDLSCMVSLDNMPRGASEGYWEWPIVRFRTNGGTVYDWHAHVGEVGHTAIFGRTGSGKTLFLSFLSCALQRVLGPGGSQVLFDKDQGMQVAVMANGGRYTVLRRGRDSGCVPLRAYDNTPRNVDHVTALCLRLILHDKRGPLEPDEAELLYRGVACQFRLPKHLRSMTGVLAFLGNSQGGAGARFAKWCRGGSHGWLFDGEADLVSSESRLMGFDFTELLPSEDRPDDGCAGAVAADIMFRLRAMMDGRRFAVIIDECRYYMDSIAGIIEDFALTGRKKEMMLVLAAQKPSHLLDDKSGIGRSILAQCPTNILFPEEEASWRDYGTAGLGCTPTEFAYIRDLTAETMSVKPMTKRTLMVRRHGGSVVVEFDLSGMDDGIAVMSGRPDTAKLMETIAAELGDEASADDLLAEFKRRWRNVDRIARRVKEEMPSFEDADA